MATINLMDFSSQELDDLALAICEERRRRRVEQKKKLSEKLFKVLEEVWDAGFALQYDGYVDPDDSLDPSYLKLVERDEED